jgi:predicted enzyme related to lactoylglutathione lyase
VARKKIDDDLSRRVGLGRLVIESGESIAGSEGDSLMSTAFVWFHNGSDQPTKSVTFYEKLFGWKGADGPPGMTMLARDGGPFAAVMEKKKGETGGWVPYVQVDDVAAATQRAAKLGAEVVEDRTRGPAGTYSVVRDPGGALFAIWQKA